MRRFLAAAYALLVYAGFTAVFLATILFIEGLWLPMTIDFGRHASTAQALAFDLGWFVLFGLQHSVMARPGFKRRWTRLVPAPVERTTYVLVTTILFALLMWLWAPLPSLVWRVDAPPARLAIWGLSFAGWGFAFAATFLHDHFELYGLRQVYDHLRSRPPVPPRFKAPALYQHVRHPMYLGMLVAFWAAPTLTVGHLLFAGCMTVYVLIAVVFEERDLVRTFGDDYRSYRERVGGLLPRLRPRV